MAQQITALWSGLVYLNPETVLPFSLQNDHAAANLEITNKSQKLVMFKIQSTDSNLFLAEPNLHVIG